MKKTVILLLALIAIGSLLSCNKPEIKEDNSPQALIIGEWDVWFAGPGAGTDIYIEFKKNQTFHWMGGAYETDGSYQIYGNHIDISFSNHTYSGTLDELTKEKFFFSLIASDNNKHYSMEGTRI